MIVTISITTAVLAGRHFPHAPRERRDAGRFLPANASIAGRLEACGGARSRRQPSRDGWHNLLDWLCGATLIYGWLFGIGKLILGHAALGALLIAVGMAAGAVIFGISPERLENRCE